MSEEAAPSRSTLELIDDVEELVSAGRRVPFSASVVVNEDELLDLIDRARLALPDDLVQARHLVEDRERILATAEQEAEAVIARADEDAKRVMAETEERAAALVADSAITAEAKARAESVVADAETHASSIRAEADAYARKVMQELEDDLGRTLATVRKGIETLPKPEPARRRRKS